MREEGAATVFGGSFALMDLPVAQIALGKEGKLDIVDLTTETGESIDTVRQRLQTRVGGAAQTVRPRERGEQVESLMTSFRVGLFFVSLIALFVGFFLIFNTVSVSVIQRKREIGTLRCLGILRRQILCLFVLEALLLALAGSVVGIGAGFLLAQGALYSVGQTVNSLFFHFDFASSAADLREVWIGLAGGIGIALLAAVYPAWQAARVTPLESARQAVWRPRRAGVSGATIVGIVLLLLSPAVAVISPAGLGGVGKFTLGVIAMMLFLLGLSFLAPLFVSWWAGFYWRATGRLPPRAGFLRNEARLDRDADDQPGGDLHRRCVRRERARVAARLGRPYGHRRSRRPFRRAHRRAAERAAARRVRREARSRSRRRCGRLLSVDSFQLRRPADHGRVLFRAALGARAHATDTVRRRRRSPAGPRSRKRRARERELSEEIRQERRRDGPARDAERAGRIQNCRRVRRLHLRLGERAHRPEPLQA